MNIGGHLQAELSFCRGGRGSWSQHGVTVESQWTRMAGLFALLWPFHSSARDLSSPQVLIGPHNMQSTRHRVSLPVLRPVLGPASCPSNSLETNTTSTTTSQITLLSVATTPSVFFYSGLHSIHDITQPNNMASPDMQDTPREGREGDYFLRHQQSISSAGSDHRALVPMYVFFVPFPKH